MSGKSVLGLRTGAPLAEIIEPIINPNNLKIEGWFVHDNFAKHPLILLSQDIREILPQGFVVNDHEVLSEPGELIRLQDILELKFTLIDKPVITVHKSRLGKVSDFAFERNGAFIQKLYVNQSILKSLTGGGLTIDRTQIVEITNRKVLVKDATVPDKVIAINALPAQ